MKRLLNDPIFGLASFAFLAGAIGCWFFGPWSFAVIGGAVVVFLGVIMWYYGE
jgi:hypothetical protein